MAFNILTILWFPFYFFLFSSYFNVFTFVLLCKASLPVLKINILINCNYNNITKSMNTCTNRLLFFIFHKCSNGKMCSEITGVLLPLMAQTPAVSMTLIRSKRQLAENGCGCVIYLHPYMFLELWVERKKQHFKATNECQTGTKTTSKNISCKLV